MRTWYCRALSRSTNARGDTQTTGGRADMHAHTCLAVVAVSMCKRKIDKWDSRSLARTCADTDVGRRVGRIGRSV